MQNFPPSSSRQSGRTTKALKKAIQLAKEGNVVVYVVPTSSQVRWIWKMIGDISKSDANPDMYSYSFGKGILYIDIASYDHRGRHRDQVVIYDHYTVELETSRIDEEIRRLLKEKEFILHAGLLGLD